MATWKSVVLFAPLAVATAIAACGGGSSETPPPVDPSAAASASAAPPWLLSLLLLQRPRTGPPAGPRGRGTAPRARSGGNSGGSCRAPQGRQESRKKPAAAKKKK